MLNHNRLVLKYCSEFIPHFHFFSIKRNMLLKEVAVHQIVTVLMYSVGRKVFLIKCFITIEMELGLERESTLAS